MLRHFALVRAFDERMFRGQRQGKTVILHGKCTGEEATSVSTAMALASDDMVFPSYRQQGVLIQRGLSADRDDQPDLLEQGRQAEGPPVADHVFQPEHSFFSISGNLATQTPQAVGWAMASAIKGDSRIAATWVGEGSTAKGRLPFRLPVRNCL